MSKQFIILDLDNCIADDAHRVPAIRWTQRDNFLRYHDYHLLAPWDAVANNDLFEGRRERIIIFTARPVLYRASTVEWLKRNRVPHEHIIMRNNHDHRRSTEVKRQMLRWLVENYDVALEEVACAYDDRQEIVDMYLAAGVPAERRAVSEEADAYKNPLTGANHA